MTHKILIVELNDNQYEKYKQWCTDLRKIFGEVGQLTWSISSNGIADTISVVSSHAPNHPLDLTDVDSW
jgi:hypothetical protein